MQTDRTSEIVGDVAIVFHPNGTAVLRGGADGRHRIAVPVDDRAAVAAALLPPGAVAVEREPSDEQWARAIEAATVVYHRRFAESGYPMWGAVVRAVWGVLAEGGELVDGTVTVRDPLPAGTGAVERDRTARLVSAARSVVVQSSRRHSDNYAAIHNRTLAELDDALADYVAAPQPGDADPLPGEGAAG